MRLKKVTVGSATYNLKSIDKAAKSITLTVSLSNALAKDSIVYTTEAGKLDANKKAADVHMSVIFGRDAYGVIDLENGALESIVKPRGSAGADDPLDQRATVGAKVTGFAAVILNELWIVRIEHGASA